VLAVAVLGTAVVVGPWLARVAVRLAARDDAVLPTPLRTGVMTAAFAALRAPERFGNVLSQSGSFWWMNGTEFDVGAEWLTRRYALAPELPVRFYVEVGLQEWALLGPTRHFRDVLEAKGYDLDYAEYNGGHDALCWRGGIADGLASLCEMWNRS